MKTCAICLVEKPIDDFSLLKKQRKDGSRIRHSYCTPCRRAYNRSRYTPKATSDWYRRQTPEKKQEMMLRRKGISVEFYDSLLERQGGGCAICGNVDEDRRLAVDHDHSCCPRMRACEGCARGLLCINCNTMLGNSGDDAARLRRAAEYLESRSS